MMRRESGFVFSCVDDVGDLVDVAAVGRRPRAPLDAVDRTKVAVGAAHSSQIVTSAVLQPARVAVAAQEPEQLEDDRAQVDLLRRDERKALAQVEAHLVAEHALRAGAGAVGLGDAMVADVAQEVFVLRAHRALVALGQAAGRSVSAVASLMEAVRRLRYRASGPRAPGDPLARCRDAPLARDFHGLPDRPRRRGRLGSPHGTVHSTAPVTRHSRQPRRPRHEQGRRSTSGAVGAQCAERTGC